MRLWHTLRTLCTPDQVAREIDEEMTLHLAMETEDLIRQGIEPAEARRRALLAFGARARHTQDAQDAWPLRPLQIRPPSTAFLTRLFSTIPARSSTRLKLLSLGTSWCSRR